MRDRRENARRLTGWISAQSKAQGCAEAPRTHETARRSFALLAFGPHVSRAWFHASTGPKVPDEGSLTSQPFGL